MVWKRGGEEEAEIRGEVPEENTLIEWPIHVQAPMAAVVRLVSFASTRLADIEEASM